VHGAGFYQLVDGGCRQGGDPVQTLHATQILADTGGGQHATITHQHDPGQAKARSQLVELGADRRGILHVTGEHLHGDGTASRIT
jgi:hypothetical protein